MKNTLIVLATDGGFLVPSLVVAQQLIDQRIDELADITLYLVDVAPRTVERLRETFRNPALNFEALESRAFLPGSGVHFNQNHVPVVSLARLVLNETIPAQYENVVYLDGDLQIVGDASPLIRHRVPDGHICAGRGSIWLGDPNHTETANYLKGIGGVSGNDYFNAGVLAFRRESWQQIAPAALKFFFEHSAACERHDQSALNAVCKGRVQHFAPAYNFHTPYADLGLHYSYAPRIIHHTGPGKPWKYAGLPYGTRYLENYSRILASHPFLRPYLNVIEPPAAVEKLKLFAADAKKALRYPRSALRKRRLFLNYAKKTDFPF